MHYSIRGFKRLEPASLMLQAGSAEEARALAAAQGITVMTVQVRASWSAWRQWAQAPFPLLPFSQSLAILLDAGLALTEGIQTLAERESRGDVRRVLHGVAGALREGQPLSAALERHGAAFPPLYVAMVRANERTGALAESLTRYVAYRSQADAVKKRVVGASIYPALILAVGFLVIAFLLAYVVPRFSMVFEDLGDRVPAMSQWLMQWGRFAHAHAAALLGATIGIVAFAAWSLSRPAARATLGRLAEQLPRLGETIRAYRLARFYRALGMLQQAGIPIVTALDMMPGLLPASMHGGLASTRRDIAAGRSLSSALEAHGLSTVVALRLVRVAERTGRMGELLQRSAGFHEEEVAQSIDWFVRLFEPLLMVAIGIVIGVVVLLMYAPIFELAGSLQ
jgi:general secretion pathway protein F